MANFINNTCDFLKNIYYFIKKYLYDVISEKLYIKSIFVVEKILLLHYRVKKYLPK